MDQCSPDFAPVINICISILEGCCVDYELLMAENMWVIDEPDFVEMSGDLPSGWEERTSRSTGQTYFLNQVDNLLRFLAIVTLWRLLFLQFTKQSTWDRPTEPATEAPTQVQSSNSFPSSKYQRASGRCEAPIFWWNTRTRAGLPAGVRILSPEPRWCHSTLNSSLNRPKACLLH